MPPNSATPTLRIGASFDHEEIADWLRALRGRPHVPGSGFDVTSVLRVRAGELTAYVAGVNVENVDARIGTHAEEGALALAVTAFGPEVRVEEIWVMGAPRGLSSGSADPLAESQVPCCGNCRQRLIGFAEEAAPVHAVALNGAMATTTLGALLPGAFSFRAFMREARAGTSGADVKPRPRLLPPARVEDRVMRQGTGQGPARVEGWLDELHGVDAASGRDTMALIGLTNGWTVAGVGVEDAAYTGTNAVQSALAIAVARFGRIEVERLVWQMRGTAQDEGPAGVPASALQALGEFAAAGCEVEIPGGPASGSTTKLGDLAPRLPRFAG